MSWWSLNDERSEALRAERAERMRVAAEVQRDFYQTDVERTLVQLAEARAEIRRLTDVIVEMRREGFNPGAPATTVETAPAETLPREVRDAIAARAEPGTPLHHELTEDAWKMLQQEKRSVEQVVTITRFGAKGLRRLERED